MTTTFDTRVEILAEFLDEFGEEESFLEFVRQNDIGLPLAWLLHHNFATDFSPEGREAINVSFQELLKWIEVEDSGFSGLDDLEVSLVE